MGNVYEAHDVRLGRHVAIKVLHQALTSPEGSRRFVQETHVIAGLSHPNIVAVHESGEAAGRLYFVMDVIDGETLRQRLRREKQLAVDEALRIVEEVASALQHAHERGIVHRDIKPENILLSGARVYVADFGLARSVVAQEGDRITESGISVGTPHYLSPEQAAAERDVGPQADQYALACVLYEMLVGEAPFTGPSATAIAMRHLSEPPPPVTTRRATVPAPVERAIHRALSKVPADRHVSVKAFADACLRSMETPTPVETLSTRPRTRPWWWVTGVAAAAVVAITTLSRRDRTSEARPSETPPAEPTRLLVVVPTAPDAAFASLADEVQRAFAQWEDADVQVVSDSSQRAGLSREALEAAARRASMRQYVVFASPATTANTGTTTLSASLHLVGQTAAVRTQQTTCDAAALRDSVPALVERLLLGDVTSGLDRLRNETRSLVAARAVIAAQRALDGFNQTRADSLVRVALASDSLFARPYVVRAMLTLRQTDNLAAVGADAQRALVRMRDTTSAVWLHTSGLAALAVGDFGDACRRFDALRLRAPESFDVWFGTAECRRLDNAVVLATNSPSRHAFRSGRHGAITAIRRAFDLLQGIDQCCVERAIELQRRQFLYTASSKIRFGPGTNGDTTRYAAYPELQQDTLAFIPYPLENLVGAPPRTNLQAVDAQRQEFVSAAQRMLAAVPGHPAALEFMAEALDITGNRAAIDSMDRAAQLSGDALNRQRIALSTAWLRVKFALPSDTASLRTVRAYADSLVESERRAPRVASARPWAGSQAALFAVVGLTAPATDMYATLDANSGAAGGIPGVPLDVLSDARRMLMTATAGGDSTELARLEARVVSGLTSGATTRELSLTRSSLLSQPLMIAWPRYRSATSGSVNLNVPLARAQRAVDLGEFPRARAILDTVARARSYFRPVDVTLDALLVEARVRIAIGDTQTARAILGSTLEVIRYLPSRTLHDAAAASALMQAIALYAQLAEPPEMPEREQVWRRALTVLQSRRHD